MEMPYGPLWWAAGDGLGRNLSGIFAFTLIVGYFVLTNLTRYPPVAKRSLSSLDIPSASWITINSCVCGAHPSSLRVTGKRFSSFPQNMLMIIKVVSGNRQDPTKSSSYWNKISYKRKRFLEFGKKGIKIWMIVCRSYWKQIQKKCLFLGLNRCCWKISYL